MDGDRKYRQRGYMDVDKDMAGERSRPERRPRGPRPPLDITGPRLPRMVQTVVAARCYNCATKLPDGIDYNGNCPKCGVALHCCKQCSHFEPSLRYQCAKPIRERVSPKDKANDCKYFEPVVTVARDVAKAGSEPLVSNAAPVNREDARAAFDNLFKK